MPDRSMSDTLDAFGVLLEEFDEITRQAHERYRGYTPADLVELDSRAQAACTYCHMGAEADRRFIDRSGVRTFDIRGQRLWLFDDVNAVVRLKKMDEDGTTRNYPTKQARDFDRGYDLPGLPMPPVRITAGYLLDKTGSTFVRTQIARPIGQKKTLWCAAVIPPEERKAGERIWKDVTRQGSL